MNNTLKIKYLDNYPEACPIVKMPREGDVGIDIYSAEDLVFNLGDTFLIKTGLSVEIPDGFWLNIRDRSSLSGNFHILAGVIDSSFRGELRVRMHCHTIKENIVEDLDVKIIISKGQKIAQMIICKNYNSDFVIQDAVELSETERGAGGFGSTGK